jgi:hypothetical protein
MGRILGALAILLLLFTVARAPISQGIEGLRTDNQTQNIVVETSASSNATVVLAHDLYLGNPAKVATITSNITETPLPISYAVATKTLTIDGLNATATHLLSLNYAAETTDTMWSALGPYMSILIYGVILSCIGFGLYKTRNGKRR